MYDIKRLQNNEEAMKLPNFATLLNMFVICAYVMEKLRSLVYFMAKLYWDYKC